MVLWRAFNLVRLWGPWLVIALAPVQIDKTTESIEEILKEYNQYEGDKPATEDELKKVIANKTAKLLARMKQSALMSALTETLNKGKTIEYLEAYPSRVSAITLDKFRATRIYCALTH